MKIMSTVFVIALLIDDSILRDIRLEEGVITDGVAAFWGLGILAMGTVILTTLWKSDD